MQENTKVRDFIIKLRRLKRCTSTQKAQLDAKLLAAFSPGIRKGLKTFAKTGDLLYGAEVAGVSYFEFNDYRIKAGIRWVI